jgi:cytochrome c oxidase subunit I
VAVGVFVGFNLTFLPQFVMGSRGMPRRYWDYDPEFTIFHQLSTMGAFILGISMFIVVVYTLLSFKYGPIAPDNPWGATTLEWEAPTPPTLYNFPSPPVIPPLYEYEDLVEDPKTGGWVRVPHPHRDEVKSDPNDMGMQLDPVPHGKDKLKHESDKPDDGNDGGPQGPREGS